MEPIQDIGTVSQRTHSLANKNSLRQKAAQEWFLVPVVGAIGKIGGADIRRIVIE
jgi:hypothetical protein